MAEKKFTELPVYDAGTATPSDVLAVVSVSGTPISKKATIEELTKAILSVGLDGATSNLSANAGDPNVLFTTASNTANTTQVTHKIPVEIGGTTYWLCVSNTP